MLGSTLLTLAVAGAIGGTTAVSALWLLNYRRKGNAPDATRKTSRKVVGVVSAGVFAVAIAVAELAGLLGIIGDLIAMFPGGFTQLLLGALAMAGFAGWLEVGVVGGTVLVVLVLAGSAAFTS